MITTASTSTGGFPPSLLSYYFLLFLISSFIPSKHPTHRVLTHMCIVFFQAFSPPPPPAPTDDNTAAAAAATAAAAAESNDVHAAMSRKYKLILASNRDEFLARPTRRPCFWDEIDDVKTKKNNEEKEDGMVIAQMQEPDIVTSSISSSTSSALSSSSSPFSHVLAGKDLAAGGTWMGVTRTGRFGVLTNVRTPTEDQIAAATAAAAAAGGPASAVESSTSPQKEKVEKERKSRGQLVLDFLAQSDQNLSPMAYAQSFASVAGEGGKEDEPSSSSCDFAGYNLLVGDVGSTEGEGEEVEMVYLSNKTPSPGQIQKLESNRLYAISNRLLDVPWAKLQRGKKLFAECLTEAAAATAAEEGEEGREDEDGVLANLLLDRLLHDKEPCSPATDTGYPLEFEEKLARICIPGVALREEEEDGKEGSSVFGTTASIVVLVRRDRGMLFYERGLEWNEARKTHVDVWSTVKRTEVKLL